MLSYQYIGFHYKDNETVLSLFGNPYIPGKMVFILKWSLQTADDGCCSQCKESASLQCCPHTDTTLIYPTRPAASPNIKSMDCCKSDVILVHLQWPGVTSQWNNPDELVMML